MKKILEAVSHFIIIATNFCSPSTSNANQPLVHEYEQYHMDTWELSHICSLPSFVLLVASIHGALGTSIHASLLNP